MILKEYRKESKACWGRKMDKGQEISDSDITLGCMLRIADATEAMATNYIELQNRDYRQKKRIEQLNQTIDRLVKSRAGYMGVITKLKKG